MQMGQFQLISDDECKQMLIRICKKLCVNTRLVAEKLLDQDAKNDMRNGNFSADALEAHIKTWFENGMPDYVKGTCKPHREEIPQ
jgi:hypothetical protein